MTRCDQRATGERYGSSSGKAEPCQGGESRGGRPTYKSYPTLEAEEEKGVRGRRGKTSRADVWRMKNSVTEHAQTTAEEELLGGWSRGEQVQPATHVRDEHGARRS